MGRNNANSTLSISQRKLTTIFHLTTDNRFQGSGLPDLDLASLKLALSAPSSGVGA